MAWIGWTVLAAIVAAQEAPLDRDHFEAGLKEVREHLLDREWKDAQRRIHELLAQHEERDYVALRAREIAEDLQRCAVRIAIPEADPRDLVIGDLQYNRRTGEVRLTCTGNQLGDFGLWGGFYLHPITFQGPYTVEVKGLMFPSSGSPEVLVGAQEDLTLQIAIGATTKNRAGSFTTTSRLVSTVGRNLEVLDESDRSPIVRGKRYRVLVKVTETKVTVSCNERTILRGSKANGQWGRVGIGGFGPHFEVQIRGKANTSWIEGLVSEATRAEEEAFLAQYDIREELPDWFHDALPDATASSAEEPTEVEAMPWLITEAQAPYVDQLVPLIGNADGRAILELLKSSPADAFPRGLRQYAQGVSLLFLGAPYQALELLEPLCEQHPEYRQSRYALAQCHRALGARPLAREQMETLVKEAPDSTIYRHSLCLLRMSTGEPEAARALLHEAREQGRWHPEFDRLESMLVKAERGPNWTESHRHESEHYDVMTNLDRRSARETAQRLEEFRKVLCERFGTPSHSTRAKVFLFQGQADYDAYTQDLLEEEPGRTLGLYSRTLKQLLIWNAPDRARMWETVRHEALHQHFDALGIHAPTWFEEGTAEYCSFVEENRFDRVTAIGRLDGLSVRLLQQQITALPPLESLIWSTRDSFYSSSGSYAVAWGAIHFLLHESDDSRALYDQVLQGSQSGLGAIEALRQTFESQDLAKLNHRFLTYLQGLDPE